MRYVSALLSVRNCNENVYVDYPVDVAPPSPAYFKRQSTHYTYVDKVDFDFDFEVPHSAQWSLRLISNLH